MVLKTTNINTSAQRFYQGWLSLLGKSMHPWRLFASRKPMPENEGQTIVLSYYDALPIPTGALVEGITPTGSTPVLNEVTISTQQYGDFIPITDAVGIFDKRGQVIKNPKSAQNVEMLGEQAMEKLNTVCRDAISLGSNSYLAGSPVVTLRGQIAAGNKPSRIDYENIVQSFLINKVKPISQIVAASAGQTTSPIGRAFIAIIGPKTLSDVSKLEGWVSAFKYGNTSNLYPYEIGALNDLSGYAIRFLMTENDLVFEGEGAGGIDVYGDMIFGEDFYGETDIVDTTNMRSFDFIVKALGSAGTEDPLDQRATFGWKVPAYGCSILKDVAGCRYEHATTE